MSSANHRPILIVEDNDEDFEATMWALKKSEFKIPVVRCTDGEQALLYLAGLKAEVTEAPAPAIVLLDLNLPLTEGRQVLDRIKTSPRLRSLPVIVVTSSAATGDVEACYRLGANSYVVKPVSIAKLREMVDGLIEYWFRLVLLPQPGGRNDS